ncbi:NAD(P)/FAD-dependent oxidoreductase [Paracoccus sp. p4-l81]|uniref:NAD(P)/FAD-dependent oxidoreductase n=1 Tax=unclassified Paracoccus (in: a-proteobacteria) TaxID=2688777 RepID=UPI0035B9CED9
MDSDFLIIGGGIAGVSAAARIAPLGRVILVEAEAHLATQSSARSAALYEATYGPPVVRELNRASFADYQASGTLSPRGFMLIGAVGGDETFARECADFELTEMPLDQARAMVPILNPATVARAAFSPDAWDIDTHALIQMFLRQARAEGAQVITRAPVSAIRRLPQGWAVTAGGDQITARVIVNAAGAWADQIAQMAGIAPIGLQPYRRSMARIPAPGGHDLSGWPMLVGPGDTFYFKPDAGALLVSPCEADPMPPHDAFPDDMVLAEGLARYEHYMSEPVTRLIASWAGLRSFAPDHNLVLGPDATDDAFVWVAGQGGYGFQTCPAASQLVADRIAGRTSALPAPVVAALDPARFSRH